MVKIIENKPTHHFSGSSENEICIGDAGNGLKSYSVCQPGFDPRLCFDPVNQEWYVIRNEVDFTNFKLGTLPPLTGGGATGPMGSTGVAGVTGGVGTQGATGVSQDNGIDIRTTDLTITNSDGIRTVVYTSVTGLRTVTLPLAASNPGRNITVKRLDRDVSPTDYLRISPSGSDEIDGFTGENYGLFGKNDQVTLRSNGIDQWYVVNESDVIGVVSFSASLTRRIGDQVDTYLISTGATDRTFTLKPAANETKEFTVKKTDAGTGKITVTPDGSETIDGQSNVEIVNQNDAVTFKSDGNNWFITSRNRAVLSAWNTLDKVTAYTLLANDEVWSTHTTSVIHTLPAFPADGTHCRVGDASSVGASSSNITVSGNGNNINGSSNYTISTDERLVEFVYVNATLKWRAFYSDAS